MQPQAAPAVPSACGRDGWSCRIGLSSLAEPGNHRQRQGKGPLQFAFDRVGFPPERNGGRGATPGATRPGSEAVDIMRLTRRELLRLAAGATSGLLLPPSMAQSEPLFTEVSA